MRSEEKAWEGRMFTCLLKILDKRRKENEEMELVEIAGNGRPARRREGRSKDRPDYSCARARERRGQGGYEGQIARVRCKTQDVRVGQPEHRAMATIPIPVKPTQSAGGGLALPLLLFLPLSLSSCSAAQSWQRQRQQRG